MSIESAVRALAGTRPLVLTGAGMSTDSGIPDYRSPSSPPRSPMTYEQFTSSPENRQRYWARSFVGWTRFVAARPNDGHRLLQRILDASSAPGLVTQNVDGLHERAGGRGVVALHGRLSRVRCLDCGAVTDREEEQERLALANPVAQSRLASLVRDIETAPDGDAEIERTGDFAVVPCRFCGGRLKPDVVFFGESVRKDLSAEAFARLAEADALLVLGSSLAVMSGLRYVRRAVADSMPVVIVTDGWTRADELDGVVKVRSRVTDFLHSWSGAAARPRVDAPPVAG